MQQDAALEEIFEVASEVLGFDLYAVIADSDAQTLAHTIYAQPAIMATSLVCLEAAKKRGFTYDAVAGHSLGEYAAMVAAGMLSWRTGSRSSRLVQRQWMPQQRQQTAQCVPF